MPRQKDNKFLDKFRLLNSQEHAEEIVWSLSDSSDYEDTVTNDKNNSVANRTRILKRKRKPKCPKNVSNLSTTLTDTSTNSKNLQSGETSPILVSKNPVKTFRRSPILSSTQTCRLASSPVLTRKSTQQKSPILVLKNSPKKLCKSKKMLFSNQQSEYFPRETNSSICINETLIKTEKVSDIDSDCDIEHLTCSLKQLDRVKEENTSTAKLELVNKVKSFFDSHFSPESSQNSQSISDIQTQRDSTKSSNEIILSCRTNTVSSEHSMKSIKEEIQSDLSAENLFYTFNKAKKVCYKKDGLAYRLNNILRKQNACLSLWHHERFLAVNSNFVIPKGENSVFRIQKVQFQYGCYLIEAVDFSNDDFLILINASYVNCKLSNDVIIKVYDPFNIVQLENNTKLLINVCRFECSEYK